MKSVFLFIILGLLVSQDCLSRSLPEDENSVVSVYTTQASHGAHANLDVYRQIAHNIAERITMPLYRLFSGFQNRTHTTPHSTMRPWGNIELQDDSVPVADANQYPLDNSITNDKDAEELSPEALHKVEQKPEKITLFSSYTPSSIEKLDGNDTMNDLDDDDFGFESVDDGNTDDKKKTKTPFVYILELIGSFIQLLYGGVTAYFSSQ